MGRIFSTLFLISAFSLIYFLFQSQDLSVASPIPKVFGINKPYKTVVNSWFPKSLPASESDQLNISAKSVLLVDYDSGDVIFAKNARERLQAASTIKIMTALVALANADLADEFIVSEVGAKVGENSMGLTPGENLTLRELLSGLMLVSGNDAAVVIAEGISLSEGAYVELMNKKSRELGLADTKFINVTGLDEDQEEQYTTAYDMSVIAHYTWENFPTFREISSTVHEFIDATETHKAFDLYNDTNLLTTYPGVYGIKPGFTWNAGLCLVTYAENDGKRLLGVILGSDDRRGEMKELLDYGFNYYGIKIDHPALDLL